jgi:hypothetical protein
MIIYDTRSFYILHRLLNSDIRHPVSSNALSEVLCQSKKTIQGSIVSLEDFAREHGFQIISKSGNGFYSLITDKKKAAKLKSSLNVYFTNNHTNTGSTNLRTGYLAIYILNQSHPVTIHALAERFCVSNATIYNDLKLLSILLSSSQIQLIQDKTGLYVITDEFKRRIWMSTVLTNSLYQYGFEEILNHRYHFIERQSAQLQTVLTILRQYGMSIGEHVHSLLFYMNYSNERYLRYDRLHTEASANTSLSHLAEYQCACALVSALKLALRESSAELSMITACLLVYNDTLEAVTPERYGDYCEEILQLYHYLDSFLSELAPELTACPEPYHEALSALARQFYFLHEFHLLDSSLTAQKHNFTQSNNALVKHLSRMMCDALYRYFHIKVSHANAGYICLFFNDLLYSAPFLKEDIRLLLITKTEKAYNHYLLSWLDTHLTPRPCHIEQMSFAEASISCLDQYDMILTSYDNLKQIQGKYTTYRVANPPDFDSMLFSQYYQISNAKSFTPQNTLSFFSDAYFFPGCHFNTTKDFLLDLGKQQKILGNIPIYNLLDTYEPINYYVGHNTIVIPFLYKEFAAYRDILMICQNDEREHLKYSTLIFFSKYTDYSLSDLVKLLNLCQELSENPGFIDAVVSLILQ